MRTPADFPARRRATGRNRNVLIGLAVIVVLLATWLRGIASFYTTYLWFDELNFSDVWSTMLTTKIALIAVFTAVFFGALWLNLTIADRMAPRFRSSSQEDELVMRYRETVGPHAGKVRLVVAALFALLVGTNASSQWESWLLFRNSVKFGIKDEQFGLDASFFTFKLPFLTFLVDWLFVALVIITVVTLVAHYLNGGIRLQAPGQRVGAKVKAHLSVLLAVMALVKAVGYYLQRFELATSGVGVVDGPTYTDVNARLPALMLLAVISLVATVLFLVNIRRQGWVLPVIAVALWAFVNVVVGTLVPAFVQRVQVEPSEADKERPYIERNIKATQTAYGIEAIQAEPYEYTRDLTAADLDKDAETIRNIRLWDPSLPDIKSTYQRLQETRDYYSFSDIDVDRYLVDGRQTQAIVSVREVKPGGRDRSSFVNRRLTYTHGFGAIVSPANAVTRDGQPQFTVKDVPPESDAPEIKLTQPRVYYGEHDPGYAIVNSKTEELDYQQKDQTTVGSRYDGKGGVPMSSFMRRVAFFLRFGDVNPLISSQVTPQSRAMYVRDIGSRVREAAPFLKYDFDPYAVLVGGRIKWVQDAYTTTSHFPYAQRADISRLEEESDLRGSFNYIRNSVKVVIDAYDGDLTYYLMDDKDPIAAAYKKIFPDLFTPGSQMPSELRSHLRYPEDMFRVQTSMYGRYHIDNPRDFYLRADEWDLSQDPGSGDPTAALKRVATADPKTGVLGSRQARMDPVYVLMRLPREEREKFLLLQPFVYRSSDDKQQNLSAFLTADGDPGPDYGKIRAFVMPRDEQVDGPALINARMLSNDEVSRTISLLGETGSQVRVGNVLLLPINNSLLYVRPMYVQAANNPVPELRKVIIAAGNQVKMGDTLKDALTQMFGSAPPTLEEKAVEPTPGGPGGPGGPAPVRTVQDLLNQADAAYTAAQAALTKGDLAEYQRQVNLMAERLRQAREVAAAAAAGGGGAGGGGGGGGSPPSSTTTTTAPAA